MKDPYYSRLEVSNSDLSWLQNQLNPRNLPDPTEAYRFGSLIDAMITEPERVDFTFRKLYNEQYTPEDFERAEKMKHAFLSDSFCRELLTVSSFQTRMTERVQLTYNGFDFALKMRCKWDLWFAPIRSGADIKSTAATSQAQFEAAVNHFDYDRQRAVYMTIAGADKDVLIGISKVNYKIYKVFINRQSELYRSGMDKFSYLAWKWFMMFGEDKAAMKNEIQNS